MTRLTQSLVSQISRAQEFVRQCQEQNLSPQSTVLLASIRRVTERGSIKISDAGRRTLSEMGEQGLIAIANVAKKVQSDKEVALLIENMPKIWARAVCDGQDPSHIERLMILAHDDHLPRQIKAWQETLKTPSVTSFDQALTLVEKSLQVMQIDNLTRPPAKNARQARLDLKIAATDAGLHTLSWNKWLYPDGHEHLLTEQISRTTKALEQTTGLHGALLGLGKSVRLHLDDATKSSDETLTQTPRRTMRPLGTTLAGSCEISLAPHTGFAGLGRQWSVVLDDLTRAPVDEASFNPDLNPTHPIIPAPIADVFDQLNQHAGSLPLQNDVQKNTPIDPEQGSRAKQWFDQFIAHPSTMRVISELISAPALSVQSIQDRRRPQGLPKDKVSPEAFENMPAVRRSKAP